MESDRKREDTEKEKSETYNISAEFELRTLQLPAERLDLRHLHMSIYHLMCSQAWKHIWPLYLHTAIHVRNSLNTFAVLVQYLHRNIQHSSKKK